MNRKGQGNLAGGLISLGIGAYILFTVLNPLYLQSSITPLNSTLALLYTNAGTIFNLAAVAIIAFIGMRMAK